MSLWGIKTAFKHPLSTAYQLLNMQVTCVTPSGMLSTP